MNKAQRIKNVLFGLLYLLFAYFMLMIPDQGYLLVLIMIAVTAMIKGIGLLIYYFSMARHMVGGRMLFYEGVIFLDFSIITGTLTDIPKIYIMIYLMIVLIFKGVIDLMRALEAKKLAAPSWKGSFILGLLCIIIPIVSLFTGENINVLVYAFVVTIIVSGIGKIISAFKKTAVLYIP